MRVFLLLMVCGLMSVQGIHQHEESFMVKRRGQLVNATEPEFAKCIPTDTIIHFKNNGKYKDFPVEYNPTCTRVKRCSGCCTTRLHTCQPDETEQIIFSVSVSKYDASKNKWISGLREIKPVREHKSCKCACLRKECREDQEFDERYCKCVCRDLDNQKKCLGDEKKFWNDENCLCECKFIGSCNGADEIRNPVTCRCEKLDFGLD